MNAIPSLIVTGLLFLAMIVEPCQIPTTFDCNNIQTNCDGASTITAGPDTVYDCEPTLILQADSLNIQGTYTALTLVGQNVTVSSINSLGNLNISGK